MTRSLPARDRQHESAFAAILATLVARVPGARAAALVDAEGETVDYAGRVAAFDTRLAAAHWRIVLDGVRSNPSFVGARWIAARASRSSFVVHAMPQNYAVVILFARRSGMTGWSRAMSACERMLAAEAGWSRSDPAQAWFAVDVHCDSSGRPRRLTVSGERLPVEILGVLVGMPHRERGWRVRIRGGVEATLVHEAGGAWYADESPIISHLNTRCAVRSPRAYEKNR